MDMKDNFQWLTLSTMNKCASQKSPIAMGFYVLQLS